AVICSRLGVLEPGSPSRKTEARCPSHLRNAPPAGPAPWGRSPRFYSYRSDLAPQQDSSRILARHKLRAEKRLAGIFPDDRLRSHGPSNKRREPAQWPEADAVSERRAGHVPLVQPPECQWNFKGDGLPDVWEAAVACLSSG